MVNFQQFTAFAPAGVVLKIGLQVKKESLQGINAVTDAITLHRAINQPALQGYGVRLRTDCAPIARSYTRAEQPRTRSRYTNKMPVAGANRRTDRWA